jgi:nicotinate-nucleotide adenylyltransferase
MEITEARKLFDQNKLNQAIEVLNVIIFQKPGDCQALLLRARIHYKMQKWGDAMNDYALILDFEPDNAEAKSGLEMAKSILGYFTPDMFNP